MEINYTNRHNLPHEVVQCLIKNRYLGDEEDSGLTTDYSVSSIVAPIQQTILKRRYPEAHVPDVIDNFFSMLGSIMHSLLEEHGHDEAITEKRFYKEVMGITISGQIDHYRNKIITDYKMTKAYKIMKGDFTDWINAQNLYSLLVEDHGYPVNSMRIIAAIRDWSEADSFRKGYPSAEIVVIPILKWSREARERYLNHRVSLLIENQSLPDDQLLECTESERWMSLKDYAVYAEGGKRATKVFDTESKATLYIAQNRLKTLNLVRRTTIPRRCISYCSASSICKQHQRYLSENPSNEIDKKNRILSP